jgi:hypothetical protein
VITVDDYADRTDVPSLRLLIQCVKCGGKNIDVPPNWKEQSLTGSSGGEVAPRSLFVNKHGSVY